jgi:hypothetical protein
MKKILYIILLITYSSCKSQIQDHSLSDIKDSIESPIFEISNEPNIDLINIYGKWEKEKSFKSGPWKDNVEYYYSKSQMDTLNKNSAIVISENNIIVSGKCQSSFNLVKDILSEYDNDNSEEILLKECGINLKDSLFYIKAIECIKPFDKIYILPDKLLVREYGAYYTVFRKSNNEQTNCISSATNIEFPFTSNDLKKYTKPFELADCVSGDIENFYCGEDKLRYIPILNHDSLSIILVPMDCGDFNLYQLLVLKNNRLISNLQVDGKWYEIGKEEDYTLTYFTLNSSNKFKVTIDKYKNNELSVSNSKDYKITNDGIIE